MIRALLAIAVLVYAGIGAWTLVEPVGPMADVGVGALDSRGLVELRAMYGGLQLGMAGFLGWCLLDPARQRVGLVAATCTIGGLGVARTGAWLVIQPDGGLLPLLCAIEVGGGLAGAAVLWATRSDASRGGPG
ncbi:MAG: DUF4345 family protein [Alphaproteobacteria bacterium]|nr:DUF4345 family protein [Alphaproteobacteria bacterium]